MKASLLLLALSVCHLQAQVDNGVPKPPSQIHREGADELVEEQDELSADVQQLVIEQTLPQVIKLLSEVEDIMDETTERLIEADTGGETIAAQTEVIEKIHAAAKEKQQQSGSQAGGAMMDMLERMMGKKGKGQAPGQQDQAGDQAGQGQDGQSDTLNETINRNSAAKGETRRVPKKSGNSIQGVPLEFRKAFDAYNRGAEQQIK